MSAPDSGPLDRDEQLGRLAEDVQLALAAGEELSAEQLAERYGLAEAEVVQLITALRLMQESLDEDLDGATELRAPELPDDYELGKELGRGGMGIVYRAHQKSLDRDVAVKVLRPGDLQFGSAITRFENEARSLARLRHRHIVSVHAVGKASGFVYFTMDLIDGMSLQELIASGQMTNGRAIKLLRQVASAMTYAHGQGVVHRDLKPANILVDKADDAFVVDFGLARDLGGSDNATLSGQMMGTPSYMSPEQALGDRDKIGEAADVYALGAILYECLTGKRPFEGLPLVQLMHAVVHDEPVAPSKLNARVPGDLEVICQKAMQKRIEDRYATVLAFAEDLERFSIGRDILARRKSRTSRLLRLVRQHRKPLLAVALPAMLLIVVAWMFFVPAILRDRDLQLGDQMSAQGNDAGAVTAYRSAIGASDPADLDLGVRVRMARALTNQAGTLLLSGADDEKVDALVQEATQLLEDVPFAIHGTPTADQNDAIYERQRLHAVQGQWGQTVSYVDNDIPARAIGDLNGSSRDATLCLCGMWFARGSGAKLDELGQAGCDALIELLGKRSFLRDPVRERFEMFVLSGTEHSYFSHADSQYLESQLIAIIRDLAQPLQKRKDAAALLNASDTMPFGRQFLKNSNAGYAIKNLRVPEEDLQRIVTAWQEASQLPRGAALRRRIAFVGETLFGDKPATQADVETKDFHLRHWLSYRTGADIRNQEDWQNWWDEHKDQDPREWLLAALGWNIAPDQVTPALAVAQFRANSRISQHKHMVLHHLLTLVVPEDFNTPHAFGGMSPQRVWEQLLLPAPEARHPVRVATLAFVNGNPEPQLLWQTRTVLNLGEELTWNEIITEDIGLQQMYVGMPRPGWMQNNPGPITLKGSVTLKWEKDVVIGDAHSRVDRRTPTYQFNGIYPVSDQSEVGVMLATAGGMQYVRDGQNYFDYITLTIVEEKDAPDTTWDVSDWLDAANATPQNASEAADSARGIATMACFLPLPDQHLALRRTFQRVRRGFVDNDSNYARCGLLLAGDASALDLPEFQDQDSRFADSHPQTPPSFWVRLALTSDVPKIRDHAFAQLKEQELLPAFRRTLQRAAQNGTELPAWLSEQVRDEPSRIVDYLTGAKGAIGGLMLCVLAMLGGAFGMLRAQSSRARRVWALIAWIASLVFANFTIWTDGTEWNSPWLGYGVNVLATWVLVWRIIPHWSWLIAAMVWTIIVGGFLTGNLSTDEHRFYSFVGLLLFLVLRIQHLVFQFRAKRRALRTRTAASA